MTFLFVPQISREPLNGFAPNSHVKRIWFLTRRSLKVKDKGQGHQRQKRAVLCHRPRQRRNRTRSLQITSHASRRDHSIADGGDFGGLRVIYVLLKSVALVMIITFHMSRRRREMCLSVCLSLAIFPHYCTCPLVVHYWAHLQLVNGFRCYDNIA